MDDEVKKSLDDLENAANDLLEKSRKSAVGKDDKDSKKPADDKAKEKSVAQDHKANGADDDKDVVADDESDKGESHETHNIDKSECDDKDIEKSKDAKKSVSAAIVENAELKKSMNEGNTAFLSLFTQVQAQALEHLNDKIEKSLNSKNDFVKSISGAVTTLVKSNASLFDLAKSQDEKIKDLEDTVDKISHEPQIRKSVQDVHAIEKSFDTSAGLKGNEKLSKSQVMQALTEAAIDEKNTSVNGLDAATYEMTKSLDNISRSAKDYIANHFSK